MELEDYGVSPNGTEISLYEAEEYIWFEEEHEHPNVVLKNPSYVAIYEYPRKEEDIPIFLYV